MSEFGVVREGEQKLWVQTPLQVTHNVWGFFVREFLEPAIDRESRAKYIQTHGWPDERSFERWGDPNHRYLLRQANPDETEKSIITDGEDIYWTHVDLPDGKRKGLEVHDWGLIYASHPAQIKILDLLEERLRRDDLEYGHPYSRKGKMADTLRRINSEERIIMSGLLLKLKEVLDSNPKTIEELRGRLFSGSTYCRNWWMFRNIGNLRSTSPNPMNNIAGQTELDFCISLDYFLRPESLVGPYYFDPAGIGCAGIGWCMDSSYRPLTGRWIICSELNALDKSAA